MRKEESTKEFTTSTIYQTLERCKAVEFTIPHLKLRTIRLTSPTLLQREITRLLNSEELLEKKFALMQD